MIVIGIICLALIANTYSQGLGWRYNTPASSFIDSPEFKKYLTYHGMKPLSNFDPYKNSNQVTPDPAQILNDLQKQLNESREKFYKIVSDDLNAEFENFKKAGKNWAEEFGEFVVQQMNNEKDTTLEKLDNEAQVKYTTFVSQLMKATDTALENYKLEADKISKTISEKLTEFNEKIKTSGNSPAQNNEPSELGDPNANKINLLQDTKNSIPFPEI